MELTLNLGYRQIFHLLNQLPANQIAKIKYELSENNITEKAKSEVSDFQKFILSGLAKLPLATLNRKHFEKIKKLEVITE